MLFKETVKSTCDSFSYISGWSEDNEALANVTLHHVSRQVGKHVSTGRRCSAPWNIHYIFSASGRGLHNILFCFFFSFFGNQVDSLGGCQVICDKTDKITLWQTVVSEGRGVGEDFAWGYLVLVYLEHLCKSLFAWVEFFKNYVQLHCPHINKSSLDGRTLHITATVLYFMPISTIFIACKHFLLCEIAPSRLLLIQSCNLAT